MKKIILLLILLIFLSSCAEETITGVEWFQTGNTQDITTLETKLSEELEDNRMGGLWDLKTPENYGESPPRQFVQDINELGTKRIRIIIDDGDYQDVDWSKEGYSHFYIQDDAEEIITGLANKELKILLGLVFWDPEAPSFTEDDQQDYSRFKTEDEIQHYLDYTQFIVNHFKDKIEYYEILNEPNIGHGTQQYVEFNNYINLVERVIPVIREEDPNAKIVVGAIASFRAENTREYLFGLLKSDVMPLVDGISFHPMYTEASPQYNKEYYYNYPSLMQEIKDTAFAHGFEGEFIADEITYRTLFNPHPDEIWTYSETVSAKYYARGIIINLGLDFTIGVGEMEPGNYDLGKMRVVQNLATVMAGEKPTDLPIEIQSEAENIIYYTFSLSNGDKLIALWTDGVAVDDDPGVNADLIFAGFSEVTAIDVFNGYTQSLVTEGNTVKNLIVRDYPLILKIK
ncbi:cellulase family glycosylhydrolase [Candidatus Woesearchaeota archaeon]|nr:cellulase family glycosylhydrolase [Candidatus Woesearchaeota archaeon]